MARRFTTQLVWFLVLAAALAAGSSLFSLWRSPQVAPPGIPAPWGGRFAATTLAVAEVQHPAAVSHAGERAEPEGRFLVLTLRLQNTSRDHERNFVDWIHLQPRLTDATGRVLAPATAAQALLDAAEGYDPEDGRAVPPGGRWTRRLVFDVPADMPEPVLFIQNRLPFGALLDGVLFGKRRWSLPAGN